MASRLLILLGTRRGAFMLEGTPDRDAFSIRGPFAETMPIQHVAWDAATGSLLAGARNKGVRADHLPDAYPEVGVCVHKFGVHPANPERLYQQNHSGAYRSDDAGVSWQDMNDGLPSRFGFPLSVHPHDPETIWTVPLNGDDRGRYMPDGAAAVWRSRDGGATWERHSQGLPQQHAYLGVLREAMAVDRLDPVGVYVGTSTGQLFSSRDEGESWSLLADFLPPISSVETVLLDA